ERFLLNLRILPMNTCTLITRALQLAARPFLLLFAFLKKVALAVFGRLQWSPPRWLSRSRAAFSNFNRAHPFTTAFGIIAIFLLSCGAAWTLHWYQLRQEIFSAAHRVGAIDLRIPDPAVRNRNQRPRAVSGPDEPHTTAGHGDTRAHACG